MVRALAIAAALAAGCFEPRYRCESDADCDLGLAGRCELTGYCTVFDATCPTERRYVEYSEALASQCFDDAQPIANVCAGGQPPATRDGGCIDAVCDALPACCEVGWFDACALEAQLSCEVACETRLAVTARRGATVEHWELVWTGTTWEPTPRTDREELIAWIGPAPGERAPRLAGLAPGRAALLVDGEAGQASLPLAGDREYHSITSVDFDRAGRDTIALGYQEGSTHGILLVDVASGAQRETPTNAAERLAWGDRDRDGFPDGASGRNASYTLLDNVDDDAHVRAISAITTTSFGGGATMGSPQLRALSWLDADRDGRLDLAAFGNQIRLHADAGTLRDVPVVTLDCEPPGAPASCPAPQEPANTSFAGIGVPSRTAPALVAASFSELPGTPRAIYQLALVPGPPVTTSITTLADDCPTCPPIVALVARDLDGDRQLDLVGLDARLRIYTALSTRGLAFETDPFPGRPTTFQNVIVSATGLAR